jgi:hypothetical protein
VRRASHIHWPLTSGAFRNVTKNAVVSTSSTYYDFIANDKVFSKPIPRLTFG